MTLLERFLRVFGDKREFRYLKLYRNLKDGDYRECEIEAKLLFEPEKLEREIILGIINFNRGEYRGAS